MMGFGPGIGAGWILMVVLWAALAALLVWAVTRLLPAPGTGEGGESRPEETPEGLLDRRFAAGEIDDEEYRRIHDQLAASSGQRARSPASGRGTGVVIVAVVALLALVGTIVWATSGTWDPRGGMMNGLGGKYGSGIEDGRGMMGGDGMMGDSFALAGTGPVATLAEARTTAERYAGRLDLQVAEVMRFDDGFYAGLRTPAGDGATEVLIDAEDGDLRIEYGPAMMWNTEYGMHVPGRDESPKISAEQARQLADEWLATHEDDLSAGEPDAYPGYYTLHAERGGQVSGMLSVNAYTGAVWYHAWHGNFVEMDEG